MQIVFFIWIPITLTNWQNIMRDVGLFVCVILEFLYIYKTILLYLMMDFVASYLLPWRSNGSLWSRHSLHKHKHSCGCMHTVIKHRLSFNSLQSLKLFVTLCCLWDGVIVNCPHLSSWGSLLTWGSWLSLGTLRDGSKKVILWCRTQKNSKQTLVKGVRIHINIFIFLM